MHASSQNDLLDSLPRFEVIRRIGAGGIGEVYEARDKTTNSRVALKRLKLIDPDSVYRFKNEFRNLASLSSHPNLIRLEELIEAHGAWFFTMEYLEDSQDLLTYLGGHVATGDTLWTIESEKTRFLSPNVSHQAPGEIPPHQIIRSPPKPVRGLDFDRIRNIFIQVARGVAYLHRFNRIHRDIKPSNVHVTRDGRVVLLDFGLVSEIDSERDDKLAGTCHYMAPEQAAGLRLSTPCDWYAVGVMLYQALTNELPFRGPAPAVLRWKQEYDAPSPSEIVSGLPEDLVLLCNELLQRDCSLRPSSVEIMDRIQAGRSVTPRYSHEILPTRQNVFIGRTDQIVSLTGSLAAARNGTSVVCHVQGASGSGKSTLIERFIKQATAEGALVLRARCFERESVPFKSVDAIIDGISRFLLTLRREDVKDMLPEGADALARMFPVLNRVPAIRDLSIDSPMCNDGTQSRQLAFTALCLLLHKISVHHTVLISIDDLQWGDGDSASLLDSLLSSPQPPPMLLILVYRSDDDHRQAALSIIRELPRVRNERISRRDISVSGLTEIEAKSLAVALLEKSVSDPQTCAAWIAVESQGIALFVHELVQQAKISGGVIKGINLDSTIWNRISLLPSEDRSLLEMIALAGQPITLHILMQALSLQILPTDRLINLRDQLLIELDGLTIEHFVMTAHDRIREIVIDHLASETRKAYHGSLAKALEASGIAPVDILAQHYHAAGDASKTSHYLGLAGDLAARQMAFRNAENSYLQSYQIATSTEDRVACAERLVHFYSDQARFQESYDFARSAVALVGRTLPQKFAIPGFLAEWVRLEIRLLRRTIGDLIDLPAATNPAAIATIRLMNIAAKAAFQINPKLCVWLSIRAVNLCLSYGNTPDCAIGYMVYGAIFTGGIRGRYQAGEEFGKLAINLVERYNSESQRAEVNFVVGYFGTSWRHSTTEAEALWVKAYDAGLKSGDLFHTGCAAAARIYSQFVRGIAFESLHQRSRPLVQVLKKSQLLEPLGVLTAIEQACLNLRGLTEASNTFSDQVFTEKNFVSEIAQYGSRHFAQVYWIVKMQSLYLWGHLEDALEAMAHGALYASDSQGTLQETEYQFYRGLIALASPGTAQHVKVAHRAHTCFVKWAGGCPENYLTRERILAGEIARTHGNHSAAVLCFTEAIDNSLEFDQKHLHGLALLLRSKAYALQGDPVKSAADRALSSKSFRLWGAQSLADTIRDERVRMCASDEAPAQGI